MKSNIPLKPLVTSIIKFGLLPALFQIFFCGILYSAPPADKDVLDKKISLVADQKES